MSLKILGFENVLHWKGECGPGRRDNLHSPQQLFRIFRVQPHGREPKLGSPLARRTECLGAIFPGCRPGGTAALGVYGFRRQLSVAATG